MFKVNASASNLVVVTPSDTVPITCNAIYVGVGGDIAIKTTANATAVTLVGVPQGKDQAVNIVGGYVMSTGTTATNLVAESW